MAFLVSRRIGLALGFVLAVQAIYSAYFGLFEPGLHRTIMSVSYTHLTLPTSDLV